MKWNERKANGKGKMSSRGTERDGKNESKSKWNEDVNKAKKKKRKKQTNKKTNKNQTHTLMKSDHRKKVPSATRRGEKRKRERTKLQYSMCRYIVYMYTYMLLLYVCIDISVCTYRQQRKQQPTTNWIHIIVCTRQIGWPLKWTIELTRTSHFRRQMSIGKKWHRLDFSRNVIDSNSSSNEFFFAKILTHECVTHVKKLKFKTNHHMQMHTHAMIIQCKMEIPFVQRNSIKFEGNSELIAKKRYRFVLVRVWGAPRWCCERANTVAHVRRIVGASLMNSDLMCSIYVYIHIEPAPHDTQPIYTRTIWYVQLSFVDIIKWEKLTVHALTHEILCVSFVFRFFAENK